MSKYFVILLCTLALNGASAQVQPQWKFYIAFEDNTGARDTLWCIWDSLATSTGVDTVFGEQAVQLDYSKFNVYIFNQNSDTTKTSALDSLGGHQLLIEAINYQHPINITWDSTILHQNLPFLITGYANYARIDNDYFFMVNNSSHQQYDMWIDDYAFAPWYSWASQSQFPMQIYILSDPSIGMNENGIKHKPKLFPNPTHEFVSIDNTELIENWELISAQGKTIIKKENNSKSSMKIDLRGISVGIYYMKLLDSSKNQEVYKIVKL